MPRLSDFIRANLEQILLEWETFARSLPMGESMDVEGLRDHAKEMLGTIADDLDRPQTSLQQSEKSKGRSDAGERMAPTAAQEHGAGRAESGFTVAHMVSEFRAMRASVMGLWRREQGAATAEDLEDMIRFNEAIDQAIAESITRFDLEMGQSKERFLAILGHDLRTPLGAVLTSARFMLDTKELHEPHLTLVTRIASSAGRMNQMVADLLEFTRTRFGDSMPIVPVDADIRRLVNDVVSEVAASNAANTIQVEATGDLRGRWDPDRLTQALTNVIANAVHHGEARSPIRVVARGEPGAAVISVHNRGPAIPRDAVANLFKPMKRAAMRTRQDRPHLGLGLYIVDRIISAHGGSIDVNSSHDDGTTFTLRLPR